MPLRKFVLLWPLLLGANVLADVYQWEWVDPSDHSLGKMQSSVLCPGGAGVTAGPRVTIGAFDLTQAYLSSQDFTDSNWTSTTLTNAYFGKSNLYDVLFYGCSAGSADLSQVNANTTNFRFTNLTQADFTDANLQAAKLNYSTLDNANFTRADLSNASMGFSTFYGTNFTDATIAGAQFDGGPQHGFTQDQLHATASYKSRNLQRLGFGVFDNLSAWDFSGGLDLTYANFTGVTLIDARFNTATLTSAGFLNANLTGADFSGAHMAECWLEAGTLANANFSGADLTSANARSQNWLNANLTGATINGASLSGAASLTAQQIYSTASYKNHDLHGVDFSYLDLSGWSFRGVDLSASNFQAAKLTGADLTASNLSDAVLVGGIFHNADFTGANLSGAEMGADDLRGARNAVLSNDQAPGSIMPDGTVDGFSKTSYLGGILSIVNYTASPPIGVRIKREVNRPVLISFIFDQNPWQSTVSFDPGIPVDITGTSLALDFDRNVDPTMLVGTTFHLFDWTGVSPVGELDVHVDQYEWDTSHLYTDGTVTLVAVPEPWSPVLILTPTIIAVIFRRFR